MSNPEDDAVGEALQSAVELAADVAAVAGVPPFDVAAAVGGTGTGAEAEVGVDVDVDANNNEGAALAAAAVAQASASSGAGGPAKKRRKTGRKKENPDDLIDILDAKAIAKKIPVVEGKGPYFPPWTWRTSIQKVREWRELTDEQQIQKKSAWAAMGMAQQDSFIRDVRIKNQARSFWLLARNGSTSTQAREDFIRFYEQKVKAIRDANDAKAALLSAQAKYGSSVADAESDDAASSAAARESLARINEEIARLPTPQASGMAEAEQTFIGEELKDGTSWNLNYQKLAQYKEQHGTACIPSMKVKSSESNPEILELYKLSSWVMRNRAQYKGFRDPPEGRDGRLKAVTIGNITPLRIHALEELGFVMDTKEENWRKMFDELKIYKDTRGHMKVSLSTHAPLYRWCDRQKLQYVLLKKGEPSNLTPERYQMLESIGFTWWNNANSSTPKKQGESQDFDAYFQQLLDFKNKHGHTRVAARQGWTDLDRPAEGRVSWKLVQWVTFIRKHYKLWEEGKHDECKLDEEKIRRLEEAGFELSVAGRALEFGHESKARKTAASTGTVPLVQMQPLGADNDTDEIAASAQTIAAAAATAAVGEGGDAAAAAAAAVSEPDDPTDPVEV
mmetsp:Transcript_17276/g.49488  ORF Transcript_17276/g.49488 Transcript_17276/m.49488 type:complete len:619 (+) Transcript_17276:239-2095(+)|eukprot:CAMPEP_0181043298 /NCGR_PEP_ID=MMETSP1070-20121207/12633_1 /TAXON_ID=265543 /ORGANISM="Minutocellus polymorphus, Strain NH13" /LENGTH=618 /DNA_ID=CAMNT_0023121617 /DNA_START=167 /DNA_END=2023 /DNA_ORIENTATION=+